MMERKSRPADLKSKLKLDSLRLKAGLPPLLWGKRKEPKQEVAKPQTALVVVEKPAPAVTPKDVVEAILDVRDLLKEQESEGEVNTYDLELSGERKEIEFRHPITNYLKPLIIATIYNDGPDTGYFKVNYPGPKTITINNGESVTLDFTKSRKKFHRVFYYTAPNKSASFRLLGQF